MRPLTRVALVMITCVLFPLILRAEQGLASYYSWTLIGKPTASREPYLPWRLTAASWAHFGKNVRVTNPRNGRSVDVWCNDRGPAPRLNRAIDLSSSAYWQIADKVDRRNGTMPVHITLLP